MKSRLRIVLAGAVAVLVAFATAASASAATYCVYTPASCPAGSTTEPTIQDAVDASNTAGGSNAIYVGSGTFSDGFNITGPSHIEIIGAGAGQTVLQSASTDVIDDASSSVNDVTIVVPDATNGVGVTLTRGAMRSSAITDAGDTHSSLTAVSLNGPAFLSDSSITLSDSNARGIADFGAASGVATVADTTIDASVNNPTNNAMGVEGGSAAETDFLRDRIIAADPVSIDGGGAITRIDDSLIEGTDTFYMIQAQSGATGTTSLFVDHDTLTGATSPEPGIAVLPGSTSGAAVAVTVRNTIIQTGSFTNLDVEPSAGHGTVSLTISYSDYDPARQVGTAITTGSGNVNVTPGFVGSGADPFALTSSSSLLDQGDPTGVEPGETSTTDLLGAPRVLAAGVGGCSARSDIGAYELNTIVTTATPSAASVPAGTPVSFSTSPCDADPNQALTVSWSFDDGGSASGTSVAHTFGTPGTHTAVVHVTDPTGRSGTANAAVTVTAPAAASPPCSGASCTLPAPAATATATANSTFSSLSATVNPRSGAITFTELVLDPGSFRWALGFQNGKFGVFAARHTTRCTRAQVKLKGKCRPKTVLFGRGSKTVAAAGVVSFTVKPSSAALRALKMALKKTRGLSVTAVLTYQSARGGAPVSRTQTITDKLSKAKKKKGKK